MSEPTSDAVATLRDAATIRERCGHIAAAVGNGASEHFTLELARLAPVADRVAALARERFPDGRIPYHSRWRHFEAGGVDRAAELDAALASRSQAERARARIDLALVSVLLDAGAGADWHYAEAQSAQRFVRSEGLGVASFRAFMAGRFSSDPHEPCRVDADALVSLDVDALADMFQVRADNPLVGLDGRAALLRRLGAALHEQAAQFGAPARPGRLFDRLTRDGARTVQAAQILRALLDAFSAIWPSGQRFEGMPVGDAWPHPLAGGSGASAGWVPFHKLSQWLSYSLLEPFEWAGVKVDGLDALTGLPEYRNGGLLLDAGVIVPRDAAFGSRRRTPADPWVIEWRALTVAVLDRVAPLVRERLGSSAQQMPLACVLEAGTWLAGRRIAAERRAGGGPPVQIESDGTVF
ncbi:MAG TPA: URC4/urg3 family protein [Burkholderiaceae bacterium]|nr:URC4/urg3 family protein [Burkholderiaceae bacterium]